MPKNELKRTPFTTSRLLEFFTEKELQMQIGQSAETWLDAILKELIDNALDACEASGTPPEIRVTVEKNAISVRDNGPGLPVGTLQRSLDYSVRISDKINYVSPTRGQLGNALKCVWAVPFVLDGEHGCVEVTTGGKQHKIEVSLDRVLQEPRIRLSSRKNGFVKNGTFIKMHWPEIASLLAASKSPSFYNTPLEGMLSRYAAFNPHASFVSTVLGNTRKYAASDPAWQKWRPSDPTSPHWYTPDDLNNLILVQIRAESAGSVSAKTVREFVSEFHGLSGTAKQKQVTKSAGLSGVHLRDLVKAGDISTARVKRLLAAMRAESRPVNAKTLGVIGQDHLREWLVLQHCEPESLKYKMIAGESADLPFVLEVAFGVYTKEFSDCGREIAAGLNWSPSLGIPFDELSSMLGECRVDSFDPVMLVVHLACPRLEFVDRGKGRLNIPPEIQTALDLAVRSVTKPWKITKRQADRNGRLMERQLEAMRRAGKRASWSIKEAAYMVMPQAYARASAEGKLPANARQIMYAARPLLLEITRGNCWKDSAYFTQKLLPDFIERNPDLTANWDVVYDARGKLEEPHTGVRIDLGTLAVRNYFMDWRANPIDSSELPNLRLAHRIQTLGPVHRYRFALFVEKEGFNALLKEVQLAERYDLAIMSTKGMSVTAARQLVAELSKHGVTVLVLRDFDKAGFSIVNSFKSNTRRWRYEATPRVIDLGLRLTDVNGMSLQSEPVEYQSSKDPRHNLRVSGATADECDFLVRGRAHGHWYSERVEINAMTSDELVQWLEGKLQEIGVSKVIPGAEVLRSAFQRAYKIARVQRAVTRAVSECSDMEIRYPEMLGNQVLDKLNNSSKSWDEVVFDLATEAYRKQADDPD